MKKGLFKKYSAFEKRDFLFVYLLILIPVLHFAIFWVYVNFSSFFLSFKGDDGWGFDNFKAVWDFMTIGYQGNGEKFFFFELLGRSFSLFALANFVAFPIGVMTTYVLFRKVIGHYFFRICYSVPTIVGSVVWAAFIKDSFQYNGPIVSLFNSLGIKLSGEGMSNGLFGDANLAFPSLLLLNFFMGIAGGNVVLTGAYARIPVELYEVGQLDGIGFWKEFFRIAVPCVWPTIATVVTFNLCTMFVADGNVFLYTNGTGEPGMATIGFFFTYQVYAISQNPAVGEGAYGFISAVGMVITIITVPVVLGGRWLLEKLVEPVET